MRKIAKYGLMTLMAFLSFEVFSGPGNIADQAVVTASTELNNKYAAENVTDGKIRVENSGVWACEGQTICWGYIRYPWVKLEWEEEKSINKIILYDRPSLEEHSAGGTLKFSDGSEIKVHAIPNNGAPKVISFPSRTVKWFTFQVTDGDGVNLGLSEIEVFPSPESYPDFLSWVNPFVETARGRYFYFTPGSTPFGMIAAAPHTRNKNQWGGGYNYNSTEILGFGQVHGWMLSGLEIMPFSGSVDPTLGEAGWKSAFSHDDEIAQPGYQRVYLQKYDSWVEYTASDRVSMYKFRFTRDSLASVLINVGGYLGSTTMSDGRIRKVNQNELEGSFVSTGRLWGGPKKVKIFFVISFDQPMLGLEGWNDGQRFESVDEIIGSSKITRRDSATYGTITQSYYDAPTAGVIGHFNTSEPLHMKISISYTSVENARLNMEEESPGFDFSKMLTETQNRWNEMLGKIEVYGGKTEQKIKFYTDLWHVLLGRHTLDDVNGMYPDYTQGERDWKWTDAELKVRQLPMDDQGKARYHMYNSDALWLTQWNVNILWGLGWPSVLDDFSASMVQYADNGGLLPRGPNAGGYSYIMTGNPVSNMLVSAYMKNMLTKVDPEHAYEVMKRNHMPGGMMGDTPEELQFYIDKGWCPNNAGKTIEWAFQDWSLAQMAKKLKKKEDHTYFLKRSESWKNLFLKEKSLLFPLDDQGNWLHTEELNGHGWVEANAWQGTWAGSHGIPELVKLIGGEDKASEMLNYAFEQAKEEDFVFGYGSGYVSYANQPGCSNAHVFNYLGKPWLSQYWVRRVNEQAYGAITPDAGYGGHDEDQGQMGGVSALMSMGVFSLKGNNSQEPVYEITSPVFDRIVIHLDQKYYEGSKLEIITKNLEDKNIYIQNASLNNRELKGPWFYHKDILKGGNLVIELGSSPSESFNSMPR
jgi:predicted alpha-1,2-mannosidase